MDREKTLRGHWLLGHNDTLEGKVQYTTESIPLPAERPYVKPCFSPTGPFTRHRVHQ